MLFLRFDGNVYVYTHSTGLFERREVIHRSSAFSYATGNGRFWDQWFKLEVEIKWKDRVGNDVITSCIVISLHQWSCLRSTLVPSDAFVRDRRRSSLPRVPSSVSPPENRWSHDWDPDPILVWCCERINWMVIWIDHLRKGLAPTNTSSQNSRITKSIRVSTHLDVTIYNKSQTSPILSALISIDWNQVSSIYECVPM